MLEKIHAVQDEAMAKFDDALNEVRCPSVSTAHAILMEGSELRKLARLVLNLDKVAKQVAAMQQ